MRTCWLQSSPGFSCSKGQLNALPARVVADRGSCERDYRDRVIGDPRSWPQPRLTMSEFVGRDQHQAHSSRLKFVAFRDERPARAPVEASCPSSIISALLKGELTSSSLPFFGTKATDPDSLNGRGHETNTKPLNPNYVLLSAIEISLLPSVCRFVHRLVLGTASVDYF